MKRILLPAVVLAAVLALPATASAFGGVALAKNSARHTVVVASRGGVVRTVRAPGHLAAVRLGSRVSYTARRLTDGTFRAGTLHASGRVSRAVLRGVVVRNEAKAHRLLLSAGGSVFSVRAPARGFMSQRSNHAGEKVEVRVRIGAAGLGATSITTLGEASTLELEGIFLSVNGNQLRLAVEHRGEVFVTIPGSMQLPQLSPGDEIELIVSVDASGAFTLVSVNNDDENDGDHQGTGEDNGRVEVHGTITQIGGGTISVQPHGGSAVQCAVPDGADLSAFKTNDRVEMRCAMVGGKLTLVRLKHEDDGDDDGGDGGGGDH
jgi:hypothetical protein